MNEPRSHEAPSRQPILVQAAGALFVGAAASLGAFGAFSPVLRGDHLRGVVVIALLLVGGGLAVFAPFRLRGWPAALCGALAGGLLQAVVAAGLVSASTNGVAAAHAMAAGFALGGVLSATAAVGATGRAGLAAALTAGLLLGTWGYALPYLPAVLGVIFAALAAAWAHPPGPAPLGLAPLAALLLAVLLAAVVVRTLGPYPFLGFVVVGPVVAALGAWWLTTDSQRDITPV